MGLDRAHPSAILQVPPDQLAVPTRRHERVADQAKTADVAFVPFENGGRGGLFVGEVNRVDLRIGMAEPQAFAVRFANDRQKIARLGHGLADLDLDRGWEDGMFDLHPMDVS